jgi:hypothetical protein
MDAVLIEQQARRLTQERNRLDAVQHARAHGPGGITVTSQRMGTIHCTSRAINWAILALLEQDCAELVADAEEKLKLLFTEATDGDEEEDHQA